MPLNNWYTFAVVHAIIWSLCLDVAHSKVKSYTQRAGDPTKRSKDPDEKERF